MYLERCSGNNAAMFHTFQWKVFRDGKSLIERKTMKILRVILVVGVSLFAPVSTIAQPLDETLETVADALVANQSPDGSWPGELGYTGSMLAGLTQAYQVTEKESYLEAAELSVSFILESAGGNFYGDEAYGLARLAEITGEQIYADVVRDFYNMLDTYAYIQGYDATFRDKAVFFIAYHSVAAHMVDANDATIWRQALISHLSLIGDDASYLPVMSMGVATWALALTGPMDDTLVDPFGLSDVSYWNGVALKDLPVILADHQVADGEYAGSFYVRFDHTAPGLGYEVAGYTEDTIFGLLGLIGADALEDMNDPEADDRTGWYFDKEIQSAREVLANAVHQSGLVQNHIWLGTDMYFVFSGEMLQAFSE